MIPDKASCNREPEYKDLIAGISEHKGEPLPAADLTLDPPSKSKVDPYQDPAYNQPHALSEDMAVEASAVEASAVEASAVEASAVEGVHLSPQMRACIDECFECHKSCLSEAMNEGRETGELHENPNFFRLMINCAEICQTTANFLLSGSPLHGVVCDVCAQNCEACAQSCDEMGGLAECAAQCRKCAASCRSMSQLASLTA